MRIYLQAEYVLDEREIAVLKHLNLTKKEDIIKFVSENMSPGNLLDEHIETVKVLDMDFE